MTPELVAVRTDGEIDEDLLIHGLQDQEKMRIRCYRQAQDRINSSVGTILARTLLLSHTRSLPVLRRTAYGRPYVELPGWQGDFNLSHSEGLVVCAVNPAGKVGVDTEFMKEVNEEVARYCLSPGEWGHWSSVACPDERRRIFFRYWTLKEAYGKLEGSGISSHPLHTLDFQIHDEAISCLRQHHRLFFRTYTVDREYTVSVCSVNEPPPANYRLMDAEELISEYLSRV